MPTSSIKGSRVRRQERAPSAQGADEESRAAAQRTPSFPRAPAEETPPARRPAPTDLAELLALGELLEGIALGTLGAGVQGRGRHPAPQSPPPPPPALRRGPTGNSGAAAAAAARAAGSSSSPSPASRPPEPRRYGPRPCGLYRLPPPPLPPPALSVTPSQLLPLRPL